MVLKYKYLLIICFFIAFSCSAQEQPIGYWSSLLPYNTCLGAVTDGTNIFAVSKQAFFTLNTKTNQKEGFSKVSGMSDIGMQAIGYDGPTNTVVLAYSNSNIDLFKNNTFYNIPDLKLKTVAGSKKVNSIFTEGGKAYLSTDIGIVVINLENQNFDETYQFYSNNQLVSIQAFVANNQYFYAATSAGLYRANKNSPQLQNFQIWEKVDSVHTFIKLLNYNNKLYMNTTHNVYVLQADTVASVYNSSANISGIDGGDNLMFVKHYGDIKILDTTYATIDSVMTPDSIAQVLQLADSSVWIGGMFKGLGLRSNGSSTIFYSYPDGPADPNSYDLYAYDQDVWIAHGGFDDQYIAHYNRNGFSNINHGKWRVYTSDNYQPISYKMYDFVSIVKDQADGTLYAGSFTDGLFELHTNDSFKQYKDGSPLEVSQPNIATDEYSVVGVGLDKDDNLWVTMFGSLHELYVREKTTGSWYKYFLNYNRTYPASAGPMTFDNAGHVWYVCSHGGGIMGYDAKGTFSDPSDDVSYHMVNGVGVGNLPDIDAKCAVVDKSDNLWIGTANGIAILYNASSCLSEKCDAEIPIVQYDKYAGYLFAGEVVQTIAVDGANRKWVGTNNGVWLLSPDAGNSSIIYRFTTDNSPLPSNHIQKIAVDKVTGDVYIGTDAGLMCFRSTATEGNESASNVITFPNPVPSGYKGTIAIKGLTENADVRITDINGQLVYRTTALGGQAVWNGMDYKGHRPQTGVYLIFSSNSDGTQTYAGKMVFMN